MISLHPLSGGRPRRKLGDAALAIVSWSRRIAEAQLCTEVQLDSVRGTKMKWSPRKPLRRETLEGGVISADAPCNNANNAKMKSKPGKRSRCPIRQQKTRL